MKRRLSTINLKDLEEEIESPAVNAAAAAGAPEVPPEAATEDDIVPEMTKFEEPPATSRYDFRLTSVDMSTDHHMSKPCSFVFLFKLISFKIWGPETLQHLEKIAAAGAKK